MWRKLKYKNLKHKNPGYNSGFFVKLWFVGRKKSPYLTIFHSSEYTSTPSLLKTAIYGNFFHPLIINVIWIGRCRECIYAFRKKSHNGTDKSVPYGRALPLIQGLTKLFCEFAKRTRALPDKQFVCRSAEKANASIHAPPRRAGSRKADFWHSQKC